MPMLLLPPPAMPNQTNTSDTTKSHEYAVSSEDDDEERPNSPYQPFTTAMAGTPAPDLTPPIGATAMDAYAQVNQQTGGVDDTSDFEEGEYVVSDTTDEETKSHHGDDSGKQQRDDDFDDVPPNFQE